MQPKEILYELLKKDGRPERQLCQYEAFKMVRDPVRVYLRAGVERGKVGVINRWGVTIDYPEDAPGAMPHITPETKVLKDITRWREQVHAPDLLSNVTEGWEEARKEAAAACGDSYLSLCIMGTGLFEQLHYLMGFEDTLTGFYEHPTEMHELIDYILENRLDYARLLVEDLHPGAILSHDDWGTKDSLFMDPDTWRTFFKEPYRKFYSYLRENGVIAMHHADSYLVPIVEDMAEIGIQIWQGVLPENDIPTLQSVLNGKMVLMGGVGAAIDRADSTEEEIRSYMQVVLENCCPGGHFIPCLTYGGPGSVYPHIYPVIDDEIRKYNSIAHINLPRSGQLHRDVKTTVSSSVSEVEIQETEDSSSLMDRLANSLRKGRSKAVLSGVNEALENGFDPQEIVSGGLVKGMMLLGEDFSAGRAFIPEMLVAAKCMTSALDVLKPLLQEGAMQKIGKVCLGTVKGDMHDIGKNLVRIMLEGGGFEVVDLGVDVPAEKFVEAAIEQRCDIIACSALLTTTMNEMRRVVQLAVEQGIRDKVFILIGGAPVTQSFCDEIGADAYTDDAAQSVLVATKLMESKKHSTSCN